VGLYEAMMMHDFFIFVQHGVPFSFVVLVLLLLLDRGTTTTATKYPGMASNGLGIGMSVWRLWDN
jgi:hypothetical protein